MRKSFIALITPFDPGAHPDHELPVPQPPTGGQPPHPDHTLPGDLPHPEHPIFWPLPPGAPVYPDIGLPGEQPHPDQGLPGPQPHPEHPIVLPPDSGGWLPIFIWGQPHPDQGLPGAPRPDHELPGPQPHPEHPIVIPPDGPAPPEAGDGATIKFKAIWTPDNGWQTIGVIVPGEGTPVPTPSKRR
jgi:hypothetical protein